MRNAAPLLDEISKLEAELAPLGSYGDAFKHKPGKVRRLVELTTAIEPSMVDDDILKLVGLTRREAWKRGWARRG